MHLIEENIVPSSVGSEHRVHRQEKYFVSAAHDYDHNEDFEDFDDFDDDRSIMRSSKRSI